MNQEHMTARHTDPETSQEAADKVTEIRQRQRAVLEVLQHYGPMTDEELIRVYEAGWATVLRQSESGLRTRRSELVKLGLVRDSGLRGTTKNNRRTIMWEVVR